MAYFFDEQYYIQSKLAHMDSIGQPMSEYALRNAITDAGMTVQEHYETYGRAEGLNPNPYFNEYEYLEAKANQLNSTGELANPAGGDWDADAVLKAITDAGMTPAEHYDRYGAFETDADGNFLNPSNAFDANAYWSAKLCELQTKYPDDTWTLETMLAAFKDVDVSPVSHYMLWGADEANASDIAFVQTVPVSQRVPNDPARDAVTGDIVPGNYMPATPPPSDTNASAAGNPADVGGLADMTISPPPVYPESSLPVPGDRDYHPLPPTINPGPGILVIPPSALDSVVSGNWQVVDMTTGTTVVVGRDGAILGQADADITHNSDGSLTITLPDPTTPVSTLPPLDPDTLPPWVTPDPDLPNHFPTPVPVTDGIWASGSGTGLKVMGTVHSSGSSSVTLAADGTIETWTGINNGAVPPATGVATDGALDASQVTGPGTLTLDTTKIAHDHAVIGSATSNNTVRLGNAKGYTGGSGKDAVTIGGRVYGNVDLGGGNDEVAIHSASDVRGTIVLGDGDNTVTMTGGSVVMEPHKLSKAFWGGAGKDVVTISGGYVEGEIDLGNRNDEVTIGGNATVKATINLADGDDKLTIKDTCTVNGNAVLGDGDNTFTMTGGTVDSKFARAVKGGAGKDTVTISGNAVVTNVIDLGDGDNFLTMTSGSATTDKANLIGATIQGGVGKDVVTIGGNAVVTAGNNGDFGKPGMPVINNGSTMYLGDGDDELTIKGSATVEGSINLGAGDNTFTMTGGTLAGIVRFANTSTVIVGGTGNDAVTISGGAVTGNIDLGDGANTFAMTGGTVTGVADSQTGVVTALLGGTGNDAVTISGGAVTGNINLGDGNDELTISGAATVTGDIYLGKGADSLSLGAGVSISVTQSMGDTGLYANARLDDNTAYTAGLDVFTLFGGSSITLKGIKEAFLGGSEFLSKSLGNSALECVMGDYDNVTNKFKTNKNGSDCLLTYDADSTGEVQLESVVLVGVESPVGVVISSGNIVISAPSVPAP